MAGGPSRRRCVSATYRSGVGLNPLILKRASASRLSGEWNDDDYDVLADSVAVGRIFKAHAAIF